LRNSLSLRAHCNILTSRMPTSNVTHSNIERHARTAKTEHETPHRNTNRATETNRFAALHLQKNFSAHNVIDPTQTGNITQCHASNKPQT
jgi:hypothetical protein